MNRGKGSKAHQQGDRTWLSSEKGKCAMIFRSKSLVMIIKGRHVDSSAARKCLVVDNVMDAI